MSNGKRTILIKATIEDKRESNQPNVVQLEYDTLTGRARITGDPFPSELKLLNEITALVSSTNRVWNRGALKA